ncbi:MAG: glycosyltransferase family 39 protein [Candidatus Riflebacteria bacterium]|nr:glycosyltransferase family 39 protein [Candidatus Riflebacteria bacterium]
MANPKSSKLLTRALPLIIFLVGALPILLHLGTAGLFETSEGRYASVARYMLDSEDWLTPHQNGLKHFTKPPLTYWLSAAGMKIAGINELGARLFLSIAAGLTALGTFYIGRLLIDRTTGILASIILVSSLFFQIQFRGLTTDPYLAAFETLMALTFFCYLKNPRQLWENAFWLMAAAAMMTKGPPGLLPLLGLIPAAILIGQASSVTRLFKSISGWIIFVIFGLGWYLLMALMHPGLLSYFLIDETIKRVASDTHQRSAPFYYFIVLLPLGVFPWSAFFFSALSGLIANFKKNQASTFLLLWLTVPLLVFTISRSKLAGYALPLLIPLALITAASVRRTFPANRKDLTASAQRHSVVIAAFIALSGMALSGWGYINYEQATTLAQTAIFAGIFWLFSSLMLIAFVVKNNRNGAFAVITLLVPALMFFILPGIRGNEPLREGKYLTSQWLLLKRIATLPPEQKIICIDNMIEGWYFYTGREVTTFNVNRVTQFDIERANTLVLNDNEALRQALDSDTMLVLPNKSIEKIENITGTSLHIITGEGSWKVAMPTRKTFKQ